MNPTLSNVLLVSGPFTDNLALPNRLTRRCVGVMHVVKSLHAARRAVAEHRYDVILFEPGLRDGDAWSLLTPPFRQAFASYVIIAEQIEKCDLHRAVRMGVRDAFDAPVDEDVLAVRLADLARESRRRCAEQCRMVRLRSLSTRIIRDRREVRRRVDLVCRDLVGAYRELAERVSALAPAT